MFLLGIFVLTYFLFNKIKYVAKFEKLGHFIQHVELQLPGTP